MNIILQHSQDAPSSSWSQPPGHEKKAASDKHPFPVRPLGEGRKQLVTGRSETRQDPASLAKVRGPYAPLRAATLLFYYGTMFLIKVAQRVLGLSDLCRMAVADLVSILQNHTTTVVSAAVTERMPMASLLTYFQQTS